MIQIYDIGNENYDRNGNAVLTPTAGRVTMQAGGACDISLTLPMDPEWKWRHAVPGAVVKAPVPREVIENSFSGYAADIYKTVAAADLREDKVAPVRINYPQWNAMDMTYTVGSRVSCYGWPHQNYECTYFDNSSPITQVPPYNSAWWKPIADYTPGAAVVVSLPAGSELYWIENAGADWYKMSTYYGVTGYIQTSEVVFDRHVSETENQPRIITEQLFRLREPSINNETRTVTVTGQHVSYDLAGILCKNITITQASPAMAMGRVVENMMMDYRGTIATNLTSEENGTYTGKTNGKNGMFMLLDPDAGIVHAFNAKFTRDNWDVFVMKKTSALSGYRISYAKNMRGVTWKKSSAGLVTRVVPVAKNTDGEDLYLPEKWVDSAHIAEYPVILMELLRISAQVGRDDGTGTDTVWTESALYDYMREKAGERFSVDHVDEVVDDLTVQFEQLGDTAEYDWIRPLESVLLYDNILCIDRDIGLEKTLTVTELEWDPIRRKVTGIRLSNITGVAGRTVTGFNVQNNSITPAKLTEEVTQEIVGQVQALIPDYTDPEAGKYTLPPASSNALGGIKIGFQASGKNYPVALDSNNKAYVYVPWYPGSYTLPLAQDGVRGGIQIGFTASGKNYPVALDGEKAYVYVPWEDHHDWADITNKPLALHNSAKELQISSGASVNSLNIIPDNASASTPKLSVDWTSTGIQPYRDTGNGGVAQGFIPYNIDSKKPDNDGTGATGTWGISVTGSARSVPWSGVGNPPATATRWPTWNEVTDKPTVFYTLPLAQDGTRGGIQIGFQASGKNYPVALDGEKAYVYVPWEDHHDWADITNNPVSFYNSGKELRISSGNCVNTIGITPTTASSNTPKLSVDWTDAGIQTFRDTGNGWVTHQLIPYNIDSKKPNNDGTGATGTWGISITGNAATVNNHTVETNVPANAVFTDHIYSAGTGLSLANDGTFSVKLGYTTSGKKYKVQATSNGNLYVNVPWEDHYDWADITNNPILFYNSAKELQLNSGNGVNSINILPATPSVNTPKISIDWTSAGIQPYRDTGGGWVAQALIPYNIDSKKPNNDGTNAYGTWGISITGNADTVDSYHAEDLLTEVDTFKRRLQVRTGSGTLTNNTDTYIAFSSPFTTLCSAVIPVSTSGFNEPNALSIVSNNKNGVTLKQRNAMGVSMNVIVVAFGY